MPIPTDNTILAQVGQALYGTNWQVPLMKALGANERTFRRWLNGDTPVPSGVGLELRAVADQRMADIKSVLHFLPEAPAALAASHVTPIRGNNGTILTDFEVIFAGGWADPEIRFKHEGNLALATVEREAWEDFFQFTGSELQSSGNLRLLAQANLPRLAPLIAQHYWAGRFTQHRRAGGTYPLVTLKEGDLRRAGPGMSCEILTGHRGGDGFQQQVYSTMRRPGDPPRNPRG